MDLNQDFSNSTKALSLKKIRKLCFIAIFGIFGLLLAYNTLFTPKRVHQESLIQSLQEQDIIKGLRWYSKNSLSSLSLPSVDICTITKKSESANCAILAELSQDELITLYESLLGISQTKENLWPYIWNPGSLYEDGTIQFSIWEVEPLTLKSLKKEPSFLGDQIETRITFRKDGISPLIQHILKIHPNYFDDKKLEELFKQKSIEFEHAVQMKKHLLGYYLTIFPLPQEVTITP